jgi:uncharacterized membrane protein
MKSILEFFKTCLIGGLFVLLPLLLFYMLFSELLSVIVALAAPIAGLFPEETFKQLSSPLIVSILLLTVTSFIFGLALRSQNLTRMGTRVEQATLMHVPLYKAVKQLSQGLTGAEGDTGFKSGLLESGDGSIELVYIIEEHDDGKLTVLVPLAPAGFTGSIKVVSPDRLRRLDSGIGAASEVIAHWGVGMSDVIRSG